MRESLPPSLRPIHETIREWPVCNELSITDPIAEKRRVTVSNSFHSPLPNRKARLLQDRLFVCLLTKRLMQSHHKRREPVERKKMA